MAHIAVPVIVISEDVIHEGVMKVPCPDSRMKTEDKPSRSEIRSFWLVAVTAAVMAFFESSSFRSSGFLYVAVMDQFKVSHELSSWPVSLLGTMVDMGGIFSGPLCQRFRASRTLTTGAVIASVGMLASAFAPNIAWISLTMGIIHGVGAGTVSTMLQCFLSMYFVKYRGTAHGIMFAGGTISSLVFPMVLYYLEETHGFKYCLLIFGAILLNLIPISFLFKEPRWIRESRVPMPLTPTVRVKLNVASKTSEAQKGRGEATNAEPQKGTGGTGIWGDAMVILRIPMFYVILVTWVIMCYNEDLFLTTIVDFAVDKGVPTASAVPLMSYLSITDTLGRVLLPLVADRNYVRRSTLVSINAVLTAISVALLPEATSEASLIVVTLLAAGFNGCGMTMYGVLLADHVGVERLPIGYSLAGLLCGPLLVLKPILVGYFRDDLGSYDKMFQLLGGLQLVLSVVWAIVVCYERKIAKSGKLNRKKLSDGVSEVYSIRTPDTECRFENGLHPEAVLKTDRTSLPDPSEKSSVFPVCRQHSFSSVDKAASETARVNILGDGSQYTGYGSLSRKPSSPS